LAGGVSHLSDEVIYLILLTFIELSQHLKELLNLFLLLYEFSILNVEAEDLPNICWSKMRHQIALLVLGDERNVLMLDSNQIQNFKNFLSCLIDNCRINLLLKLINNFSENPLRFFLQIFFSWV